MRLLILGASGRCGRWLTRAARGRGHEVTVLVRPAARLDPLTGIRVLRGSVLDSADVEAAVAATPSPHRPRDADASPREPVLLVSVAARSNRTNEESFLFFGKEHSPLTNSKSKEALQLTLQPLHIALSSGSKVLNRLGDPLPSRPIKPSCHPQSTMGPLYLPAHGPRRSWRRASSWETTRPCCRSPSAASSSSRSSAVSGSSSKGASRRARSTGSEASRRRYSTNRSAAWTSGSGRSSTRVCSRSFSVMPLFYTGPAFGSRIATSEFLAAPSHDGRGFVPEGPILIAR